MSSRNTLFPLLAALILATGQASAQALFAGGTAPSGNAGAGQTTYAQACIACHGTRLEGSPFAPALVGLPFQNKWRGKPATELLAQMSSTMPPKGSPKVKAEVFPDLLAFLVKANLEGPPQLVATAPAPATVTKDSAAGTAKLSAAAKKRLNALTPVTESMLAAPPEADWLMWRRTFDAAGFSPLTQIDRRNVQRLQQMWSVNLGASTNEITPLVHDGVLFVYSGNLLQAIDATDGKELWRYQRGSGGGQESRMRSIAIRGHSLFVPTPDGRLLALDTRSGKLLWDRSFIGTAGRSGYVVSAGPLVARGVVMVSVSLGLSSAGGCFIVGLDADTGDERWRFHTVAQPGTPGGDTWNGAPVEERFGAGVWTAGSYDPTLNLAYFGVGNTYTTATLLLPRPGSQTVTTNDGLYTDSTLALRPETGELVWHHQHHHRDVWDQDWAFEQTVVTIGRGANARRAIVTSGKTGIFEAVDAATGKFLFAHDTGFTNLFLSIDAATGAKRPNPALEPTPGNTLLLCPSNFGARNWPATSLNPATQTLFVPMLESCADFTWNPRGATELAYGGSDMRFSPRPRPDGDGKLGRMMALDLATQQVKWTHRQRMPLASSLLATAGGVVFMSDLERSFSAFDQDSGAVLWHTKLPAAAESTPITYAVNGKQYIAVVTGEGSHLGLANRRLVPELDEPNTQISLVVFALK